MLEKIVFRKTKAQFIKWEDVKDIQILTRPNGYAYVIISDSKIKTMSSEEVLKRKNIIYFTYNDKAIKFINNKITTKSMEI